MKNLRIILAIIVALLAAGCCTVETPFVAVPPTIFRSEVSVTNRIALPLTAPSRESLMKFLRAGGNRDNLGDGTVVDLAAEQHYGGLLDLLGREENLAVTNLTERARFKRWLPGPAVRQVVDARESAPPVPQPFALRDADGKYWWIFYHRHHRLTHVLVMTATPTQKER